MLDQRNFPEKYPRMWESHVGGHLDTDKNTCGVNEANGISTAIAKDHGAIGDLPSALDNFAVLVARTTSSHDMGSSRRREGCQYDGGAPAARFPTSLEKQYMFKLRCIRWLSLHLLTLRSH